eukprot:scaffold234715_cov27-Tisochrysis_lutea.AAC.2
MVRARQDSKLGYANEPSAEVEASVLLKVALHGTLERAPWWCGNAGRVHWPWRTTDLVSCVQRIQVGSERSRHPQRLKCDDAKSRPWSHMKQIHLAEAASPNRHMELSKDAPFRRRARKEEGRLT